MEVFNINPNLLVKNNKKESVSNLKSGDKLLVNHTINKRGKNEIKKNEYIIYDIKGENILYKYNILFDKFGYKIYILDNINDMEFKTSHSVSEGIFKFCNDEFEPLDDGFNIKFDGFNLKFNNNFHLVNINNKLYDIEFKYNYNNIIGTIEKISVINIENDGKSYELVFDYTFGLSIDDINI